MPVETPEAPKTIAPASKPGELAVSFLDVLNGEAHLKPKPVAIATAPVDDQKTKDDAAAAEKAKLDAAKEVEAKAAKDKADAELAEKSKKVAPELPNAPTSAPDYDKIAEAAARGVATAMRPSDGRQPAPADELSDLNDEERDEVRVLERMEKDFPQYKGKLKDRYLQTVRTAEKFEEEWLAKHPDLDADSPEFSKDLNVWREKNEPEYADIHHSKVVGRMEAERLIENERGRENKVLKELQAKEKLREEAPRIVGAAVEAARSFFSEAGDQFKDVLDKHGNINTDVVKKLHDDDPVNKLVTQAAESVEAFASTAYRLAQGLEEYNQGNAAHVAVAQFFVDTEAEMARQPVTETLNDKAQRFATAEQYEALADAHKPFYYKLTAKEIAAKFAQKQAQVAKSHISIREKELEQFAQKRGYTKQQTPAATNNGAAAATTPAAPATPPPPSPSGASAPVQTHTAPNGTGPKKGAAQSFYEVFNP